MMYRTKPHDIDKYIAGFTKEKQKLLKQIRYTIRKAAPKAQETISYGMPAFKQDGMLVYFAAWKDHIGFYPTSSGIKTFRKDLSVFKVSKGTVQFPLDKPLPAGLVTKIVKFRVKENLEKRAKKK
ncbi:MAG: iron chaperone [Nitrosopumilaceae archaeon]